MEKRSEIVNIIEVIQSQVSDLKDEFNDLYKEFEDKIEDLEEELKEQKKIDTGIGTINYSTSGSIDSIELMEELAECIKNNGVRYTINVLNNAK